MNPHDVSESIDVVIKGVTGYKYPLAYKLIAPDDVDDGGWMISLRQGKMKLAYVVPSRTFSGRRNVGQIRWETSMAMVISTGRDSIWKGGAAVYAEPKEKVRTWAERMSPFEAAMIESELAKRRNVDG